MRVFGVSDTIPFHIQLNGPISSLCEFFPPDALHRITSSDSSLSTLSALSSVTTAKSSRASNALKALKPCVRVLLVRQVVVNRDGNRIWRNSNIGQGVVRPLPPPLIRDRCLGTREESLDWTGHIKCDEDIEAGSFVTSSVHVQVRRFFFVERMLGDGVTLKTVFHDSDFHTARPSQVAFHRADYQYTHQTRFRLVF